MVWYGTTPSDSDQSALVASAKAAWYDQRRKYRQLRRQKCTDFRDDKIDADRCNPRRLWQSVDVLLGRGRVPAISAIDAESFNRFRSYLLGRSQYVRIGTSCSSVIDLIRLLIRWITAFCCTKCITMGFGVLSTIGLKAIFLTDCSILQCSISLLIMQL